MFFSKKFHCILKFAGLILTQNSREKKLNFYLLFYWTKYVHCYFNFTKC